MRCRKRHNAFARFANSRRFEFAAQRSVKICTLTPDFPDFLPPFCSMKIREDVWKYAAEQGIVEEEALKKGMEEKSHEFQEKGAELYSKA